MFITLYFTEVFYQNIIVPILQIEGTEVQREGTYSRLSNFGAEI